MRLAFIILFAVAPAVHAAALSAPPPPAREFRGVWVATVANIDWPSKPGLSTQEQQREAIAILERCRALRFNAVILQVRPHADALYASKLEPWSYYLTGREGAAPEPFYDPLEFWVAEAHARGLELHAWLNPYRANHPAHKGEPAEGSLVRRRPELVVKLGNEGYAWMDPALRGVQDHSYAVVMDIVGRYDVDGIHFDDYFYPYPAYNGDRDFPDEASWQAYRRSGGKVTRGDFRRRAVDAFIERVSHGLRDSKRRPRFGISPFGIWRPGVPEGTTGFDAYDQLYADARLWLHKGWVDYLTPQLYWPISRVEQSFPVLLRWWLGENRRRRHLWPGLMPARALDEAAAVEMVNQVMVTRGMTAEDPGHVVFSMKVLFNDGLAGRLTAGPHAKPALVPRTPWVDKKPPAPPSISARREAAQVAASWTSEKADEAFLWLVYAQRGGRWSYEVLPGSQRSWQQESGTAPAEAIAISAVDRTGNESRRTVCAFSTLVSDGAAAPQTCTARP